MLLPVAAAAQTTTLSVEATAINGKPLASGRSGQIVASPGDIIEVKFWIRDWSPHGEILRSYQVTLDPVSFTSGPSGQIAPVGYDETGTKSNEDNSFIDESDPDFVHRGEHIIPLVQAIGTEYKWISVVFDSNSGPVSNQDGTKKSCATIRLQVSKDARGKFTIAPIKDPELTLFNDPKNNRIVPLDFEPLTIVVPEAGKWARITSSIPPSGAIDARVGTDPHESNWSTITLISDGDASSVSPGDFKVEDGTNNPPTTKAIRTEGSQVIVNLDHGIRDGRWTTVTHRPSGSTTRIGYLPGDVNNNGTRDTGDLLPLIESLNEKGKRPLFQTDLDADGTMSSQDLVKLIDLLTDPSTRAMTIRN